MSEPCKNCGACDHCEVCDHCKKCKHCGKEVITLPYPIYPPTQPTPSWYVGDPPYNPWGGTVCGTIVTFKTPTGIQSYY